MMENYRIRKVTLVNGTEKFYLDSNINSFFLSKEWFYVGEFNSLEEAQESKKRHLGLNLLKEEIVQ